MSELYKGLIEMPLNYILAASFGDTQIRNNTLITRYKYFLSYSDLTSYKNAQRVE